MNGKARDRLFLIAVFITGFLIGIIEDLHGQAANDTARARAIIERHIAAVGGAEAYSGATQVHMVLNMTMPTSQAVIRIESWHSSPKIYSRSEMPGMGTIEFGFDGKTGWTSSPQMGVVIIPELPKEMTGPRDPVADLRGLRMSYLGTREIDGKLYEVLDFMASDTLAATGFFDPKSGLMVGMTPKGAPASSHPIQMTFEDWKPFGKVLYATRMTTRTEHGEMTMRVESLSTDRIDPKVFELPPKVRELSSKKPQ